MRASDTIDTVTVQNLEQIQELDPEARPSRAVALVMASFGGACIVFASLALMRSGTTERDKAPDPLSELLERAPTTRSNGAADRLSVADVTFPSVVSDQTGPTTAMEVVRAGVLSGASIDSASSSTFPSEPPPAMDRLPVVPLPAQDVLESVHTKVPASDTLQKLARHVSREPTADGPLSEPGHAGGYQLQVSSFRKQSDADHFSLALRRRGHRAYVQMAHVKGRGVWYRVRIGPFRYKRSAKIYRQDFEGKERMVTFIVRPPKTRIRIGPAKDP